MSKVKFVSPSGKVVWLGEKVLQGTSIRQMGYRPYDEVYAPVEVRKAPIVQELLDSFEDQEEKPKRGRPRAKTTVSDADQA
jgi:hypothetical protein